MLSLSIEDGTPAIRVQGKLTRRDYQEIEPDLVRMLESPGLVNLVIELDHFEGWEPEALFEDLQLSLRYRREIGRLAVVGDHQEHQVGSKLTQPLFAREIRLFSLEQRAQARSWASGADGAGGPVPEAP